MPVGDDEDRILEKTLDEFTERLSINHPLLFLHQNTSFSLLEQEIFTLQRTENTLLFRDYINLTLELELLNENSKRGTLEYIKRNIMREIDQEVRSALEDPDHRSDVLKRVDRAALNFLDDNMVNAYLARALTNLSQAVKDDFRMLESDIFALHPFLGHRARVGFPRGQGPR